MLSPDKKAAVVTLLNFGPGLPVASVAELSLNVILPFRPTKVESVERGEVTFESTPNGGATGYCELQSKCQLLLIFD